MKVSRIPEVPEEPAQSPLFTADTVTRQILAPPELTSNLSCSVVNFQRGVKNKYHTHSSDQILIVTSGIGIVATENEQREISVGDVVLIPAGEKHWHGARQESYMGHITVTSKDSKTTQLED